MTAGHWMQSIGMFGILVTIFLYVQLRDTREQLYRWRRYLTAFLLFAILGSNLIPFCLEYSVWPDLLNSSHIFRFLQLGSIQSLLFYSCAWSILLVQLWVKVIEYRDQQLTGLLADKHRVLDLQSWPPTPHV
jgi:hypothetical protein